MEIRGHGGNDYMGRSHSSFESSSKSSSIGIDIGWSRCFVAVSRGTKAKVLENSRGARGTPACVAFTDEEGLVGSERRMEKDPRNAVYGIKRIIGRRFENPSLQYEMKRFPFRIQDEKGVPMIQVQYRNKETSFRPEQIYAMMLTEMKNDAEDFLKRPVTRAVITVPFSFDESQRRAIKDSARIAGLFVTDLIHETTAAVIQYAIKKQINNSAADREKMNDSTSNVLVFHLGGGICTAAVATIDGHSIQIRAACSSSDLGGTEFEESLLQYLMHDLRELSDVKSEDRRRAIIRLRAAIDKAKIAMCHELDNSTTFEAFLVNNNFSTTISRKVFNSLNKCYTDVISAMIDKAKENAKVKQIDVVVTAGAATRMQSIQKILESKFEGKITSITNPDEIAARGAAAYASTLSGECFQEEQIVLYDDISSGRRSYLTNIRGHSDGYVQTEESVGKETSGRLHDNSECTTNALWNAIQAIERPTVITCLSRIKFPGLEFGEIRRMETEYTERCKEEAKNRKIDERLVAIESHLKQLLRSRLHPNIMNPLQRFLNVVERITTKTDERPDTKALESINKKYDELVEAASNSPKPKSFETQNTKALERSNEGHDGLVKLSSNCRRPKALEMAGQDDIDTGRNTLRLYTIGTSIGHWLKTVKDNAILERLNKLEDLTTTVNPESSVEMDEIEVEYQSIMKKMANATGPSQVETNTTRANQEHSRRSPTAPIEDLPTKQGAQQKTVIRRFFDWVTGNSNESKNTSSVSGQKQPRGNRVEDSNKDSQYGFGDIPGSKTHGTRTTMTSFAAEEDTDCVSVCTDTDCCG